MAVYLHIRRRDNLKSCDVKSYIDIGGGHIYVEFFMGLEQF
jgi:hypothetical protein